MSNIIDLLQVLGEEACFHTGSNAELQAMLDQSELDPSLKDAIWNGDGSALRSALGQGTLVSFIMPAEEEEEDGEGEKEDEQQRLSDRVAKRA